METKPAYRISNSLFWLMVVGIFLSTQLFGWELRYVLAPFRLLSTWVHEMGHGVGAVITDGHFQHFFLNSDMSGGHAVTTTRTLFSKVAVLVIGLLAPSLAGFLVLVISRRAKGETIVLWLLFAALLATSIFKSGDMFTRLATLALALPFGLIAFFGNSLIRSVFIHIVGILFCVSAISHLDYFFMRSSKMGRPGAVADTEALANILGGPQGLWGGILTVNALLILYLAARFSMVKSGEKPKTKVKPVR